MLSLTAAMLKMEGYPELAYSPSHPKRLPGGVIRFAATVWVYVDFGDGSCRCCRCHGFNYDCDSKCVLRLLMEIVKNVMQEMSLIQGIACLYEIKARLTNSNLSRTYLKINSKFSLLYSSPIPWLLFSVSIPYFNFPIRSMLVSKYATLKSN